MPSARHALPPCALRRPASADSASACRYEAEDTVDAKAETTIAQVDAVAIGYPNGRMYTYVQLADIGATVAA